MGEKSFSPTDQRPRRETLAAAKWWGSTAEAFRQQEIPEDLIKENPALKLLHDVKPQVTSFKIRTFMAELAQIIEDTLDRVPEGVRIGVKSLPDMKLLAAIQKAGFGVAGTLMFSSLTYTDIRPGRVVACTGTVDAPGQEKVLSLS